MMARDTIRGFLDGIRPEERISAAEWAEKYRYLSRTASAEPGRYSLKRTPFLREILEMLSAHTPVQKVVFMKAAQVGATEAAFTWLGYMIDISPCPMLAMMPTDETMRRNSKIRFDPMVEATPRLRNKIAKAGVKDANNTILQKQFPNGVLTMTGANSSVGLRSLPIRAIMMDEVDGYPLDLDGEGSPVDLATARSRTFARRKIFLTSTPKKKGESLIESEFMETDQRYYNVPCPECGAEQPLKFEQLRWEPSDYTKVEYECAHCHARIPERKKTEMMAQGRWVPSAPENIRRKVVGYHINSLYSPLGWYSWAEAVEDYDKAVTSKLVEKMKTFTNTVLGLPYEEDAGEKPDWEMLYARREDYAPNTINDQVFFVTAGVDVQGDRLEVEIVGWGRNRRSWSIDYRVLIGDTAKPDVWAMLGKILDETWKRPDGYRLPVRMMAVDSGYNTTHVYAFCGKYSPDKVMAVKGNDRQALILASPKQVNVRRNGKKATTNTATLWSIGVSLLKTELYSFLRNHNSGPEEPPGFCHFPQYPQSYFRGLTAEELKSRLVNGYRQYHWVKKYVRNEPLDCRNYARVAAAAVGIDRFSDSDYDAMLGHAVVEVTTPQKRTETLHDETLDRWL